MAARMDPHAGGLHELVFDRTPLGDEWTCFFAGASPQEMREFRTKGLWERHPTKPALWKYAEQAGNMVALTGETKLCAGEVEEAVEAGAKELVRSALVGGNGRVVPFLLLELVDTPAGEAERDEMLNTLCPVTEREK